MEVSKLNFYSIGTAAENKALDSQFLEVVPLEDQPFLDGELTDNATKYTANGTDADGSAYNHEIDTSVTVKAAWLPFGQSNRQTPPDIRRGEMVVLFRFADNDEFWWTTIRNDNKLRRLETVIYGIVATSEEDVEATHENMYWIEMSSHQKLIHLHTSKANGEFCTYDIQINAGDGCIVIQDDQGNYFSFDSKNHRIELYNQDGSHIDVNKTSIAMTATDTISHEAKTINMKATTINMTADTVNSKATWNHTGTIASSGDVTAGGISLMKHTHMDADTKEGKVGPPQ